MQDSTPQTLEIGLAVVMRVGLNSIFTQKESFSIRNVRMTRWVLMHDNYNILDAFVI